MDDEPGILHIFGEALQQNGFQLTTAENFLSAFAALHQARYDLLILDKITGYLQVLERFRALMKGAPMLLISGLPDDADAKSLMEGKLDRVIQKPIGAVALLAHVYACLPNLLNAACSPISPPYFKSTAVPDCWVRYEPVCDAIPEFRK